MVQYTQRLRVGTVEEVKQRGSLVMAGSDRPLAIFYHQEHLYAIDNRCPHMGFPLHRGTTDDGILTCHWHHARFDLASGCAFDPWADNIPAYPVEIRDGEVWVTLQAQRGKYGGTLATSPTPGHGTESPAGAGQGHYRVARCWGPAISYTHSSGSLWRATPAVRVVVGPYYSHRYGEYSAASPWRGTPFPTLPGGGTRRARL